MKFNPDDLIGRNDLDMKTIQRVLKKVKKQELRNSSYICHIKKQSNVDTFKKVAKVTDRIYRDNTKNISSDEIIDRINTIDYKIRYTQNTLPSILYGIITGLISSILFNFIFELVLMLSPAIQLSQEKTLQSLLVAITLAIILCLLVLFISALITLFIRGAYRAFKSQSEYYNIHLWKCEQKVLNEMLSEREDISYMI